MAMKVPHVRGEQCFDVVNPLHALHIYRGCVCLLDGLLKSFREEQRMFSEYLIATHCRLALACIATYM